MPPPRLPIPRFRRGPRSHSPVFSGISTRGAFSFSFALPRPPLARAGPAGKKGISKEPFPLYLGGRARAAPKTRFLKCSARETPRGAIFFFFLVSPLYLSQFFISLPFHLFFPKRRNLATVKLHSVQGKAKPPQEEPPRRKLRERDRYRALLVPRDARGYNAEKNKFRPTLSI